jgi:hypothetical protein
MWGYFSLMRTLLPQLHVRLFYSHEDVAPPVTCEAILLSRGRCSPNYMWGYFTLTRTLLPSYIWGYFILTRTLKSQLHKAILLLRGRCFQSYMIVNLVFTMKILSSPHYFIFGPRKLLYAPPPHTLFIDVQYQAMRVSGYVHLYACVRGILPVYHTILWLHFAIVRIASYFFLVQLC